MENKTKYEQELQKEAEKLARIITNQMDTVDGFGGFDVLPESVKLQAIDRMKAIARYVLEARADSYLKGRFASKKITAVQGQIELGYIEREVD